MPKLTKEQISILEKADEPAVLVYRIKKDCDCCDFDESNDRFHCAFDKWGDSETAGKTPMCLFQLQMSYVPLCRLKKTEEFINKGEAQDICDKLNYLHYCAVRHYLDDSLYTRINEAMKDITKEEAKEVVERFHKGE